MNRLPGLPLLMATLTLACPALAQGAGPAPPPRPGDQPAADAGAGDAAPPTDAPAPTAPAAGGQPSAEEPTDEAPAPVAPTAPGGEPAAAAPAQAPRPGSAAPPPPGGRPPPAGWPQHYRLPAPGQPSAAAPKLVVPGPEAEEATEPAPRDLHHRFGAELGLRTVFVLDEGFEPYGTDDVNLLGQLTIAATFVPLELPPLTLGIVPEYNVGHHSALTRGQEASLTVHRLAGGVLLDVAIIRHFHIHARVAAGAYYLDGNITDAAIERPLTADNWTWGLDTTAGLSVLLGAPGDREEPTVGLWLRGEWGYAFAGEADMDYSVEEDDEDPRRFGTVRLPAVSPNGILGRLTFGLSF